MGRFILYSQRAGDKINSQPDWPPPVTGYQHTHSFVTLTESGIVSDAKQTKKSETMHANVDTYNVLYS